MKKIITILSVITLVFSSFVFTPITFAAPLADGLVSYWNFDDGLGLVANEPINNFDGTLTNGPSWVAATPIVGSTYALNFDGVNDYVEAADPGTSDLDVDTTTLSAWINIDPTMGGGTHNIIRKGHFGNRTYGLDVTGGKLRGFAVFGGVAKVATGATVLPTGGWLHVAMTYDGSNVQVYVNGAADGSPTSATGSIDDNNLSIRIGGQPAGDSGGALAFKGDIDEVRIYNRALFGTEVTALFDYDFDGTLTPTNDYNPIGSNHTVTATIDPALSYIPVLFAVTGVNPNSGTIYTAGDGTASFTYPGSNAGSDTIKACVDANINGSCDGDEIIEEVTKNWLENFITGGGNIKSGKTVKWTFSGVVGVAEGIGLVGNFQIVDHSTKNVCRFDSFTSLEFSGGDATSPAANNNTAEFSGPVTCSNGTSTDLTVKIQDLGEPGANIDKITILDLGIDSSISGGNFQVHDISEL